MTLEKISGGSVKLTGRIDANNAKQFENELFAAAGGESITLDASGDGRQCIDIANHSNLHHARHDIISHGINLTFYHLGRNVVELLNSERILHGEGSDDRKGIATKT